MVTLFVTYLCDGNMFVKSIHYFNKQKYKQILYLGAESIPIHVKSEILEKSFQKDLRSLIYNAEIGELYRWEVF